MTSATAGMQPSNPSSQGHVLVAGAGSQWRGQRVQPAPCLGASPEAVPAASAPWVARVAADLRSTEQAFAQAREGFMQPAPIDR